MCTGKYIECSTVKESRPKRKVTRRQDEVLRLHGMLPPMTEAQRRWMLTVPFSRAIDAHYWKRGRVWCMNCGHVEEKAALCSDLIINLGVQKYFCPKCGQTLRLVPYDRNCKSYHRDDALCTVVTTFRGWQVLRTYNAERVNCLGKETERRVEPIYETWISADGRETVIGVQYTRSIWNVRWLYGTEWSPKHHQKGYAQYYQTDIFDTKGNWFYPYFHVTGVLRRNGWDMGLFKRCSDVAGMMRALLTLPYAEELVKTGQTEMFAYFCKRGWDGHERYMPSVHVCNRRGYVIRDASLWADYIRLLGLMNLDTHNAHYVCPENLREAHDRLVQRRNRILERQRRERLLQEARENEEEYQKTHGRYFGIVFSGGGITVHVVSSVAEMAEEGERLHHCVFVNEYYRESDSIILSARDSQGERLETVEVSTKTWEVVQSRGLLNNPTERHDDIVRLVNENMNKLKTIRS